MKKLLLSLGLGILSFAGFSQVQLNLTGSCQYAGSYTEGDISWADASFWEGVAGATQSWGTPNMLVTANGISGNLVLVEGVDPVSHGNCTFDMACNGFAGISNAAALNGNIAVIRRGGCEFGSKALAAQNAGAIACIIVNAVGAPINMGGGADGASVTIPTVMVSGDLGATICDAITAGCPEAFFGNAAGSTTNNLSLLSGEVYLAGRAMDISWVYDDVNDIHGFTPGALVTNMGTANQTGITVTCEIFEVGNATALYSETSAAFDLNGVTFTGGIPATENNWVAFTTPFTNTLDNADFEVVYTINYSATDDAPNDNVYASYFGISDEKYAFAQIDPMTGKPVATSGAGPNTDPANSPTTDYYMVCNHYSDANGSNTMAIGTWFQAFTYDPLEATAMTGKIVECIAYEWVNTDNNYDMSSATFTTDTDTNQFNEITRGEYFYGGDYQDSLIYVAYDEVVDIEDNKHYLFCNRVNVDGNLAGLTGLKFRLDNTTDYTITNGAFWDDANGTGVPSSTGGSVTTAIIEDGTFYSAGYGFEEPSNSIIKMDANSIGVEEIENERDLVAYPNPAVDMITVPFGNVTGTATINIVDVAGRVVSTQVINLTGGNVNIDVTDLESGLYNFNVVYADGTKADFKVVVSK